MYLLLPNDERSAGLVKLKIIDIGASYSMQYRKLTIVGSSALVCVLVSNERACACGIVQMG